jgi:uncharacterized alkaline shock family protein YloU
MAENKDYLVHQEEMGNIQISEEVVASIAVNAAVEVDGVGGLMSANVSDIVTGGKKLTSKGIKVEMDGNDLMVSLYIIVRYGCAVGEVAKKVQQVVFSALEGMTGFKVSTVNVHVGGISFN